MYQLHFLLHLTKEFKQSFDLPECRDFSSGADHVRILSIFLRQETRFLPGFTSCLQTQSQAEAAEARRPGGVSGKKTRREVRG
jgi:hypothetical protein